MKFLYLFENFRTSKLDFINFQFKFSISLTFFITFFNTWSRQPAKISVCYSSLFEWQIVPLCFITFGTYYYFFISPIVFFMSRLILLIFFTFYLSSLKAKTVKLNEINLKPWNFPFQEKKNRTQEKALWIGWNNENKSRAALFLYKILRRLTMAIELYNFVSNMSNLTPSFVILHQKHIAVLVFWYFFAFLLIP